MPLKYVPVLFVCNTTDTWIILLEYVMSIVYCSVPYNAKASLCMAEIFVYIIKTSFIRLVHPELQFIPHGKIFI